MSDGSVVLVSGGSRGLGAVLSAALLDSGYRVGAFSRKATGEVEALAGRGGSSFHFTEADMADAASLSAAVEEVERELGPIAGLVNNAGMAIDGVLAVMPVKDVERLVDVNLTGTLRLTRLVARKMIVRSTGTIVNVSSIIGRRGYSGLAVYSATKAGMEGMTRALARELGPRRIRVNAVAPGYLETEMTHGLDESQREQIVRRTPLGRLGRAEDVVGAVRFLLSDDAAFVTGQTLVVDGGITC